MRIKRTRAVLDGAPGYTALYAGWQEQRPGGQPALSLADEGTLGEHVLGTVDNGRVGRSQRYPLD